MAGTYLETLTVVKQGRLDKDDIIALAAGVLKVEVVSQKNYVCGESFGIEIKVRADVDTSVLEKRVKQLLEDRKWFEKYKESTKREKELLARVKQLEEENKRLMALQKKGENKVVKQETKKLRQEFKKTSKELLAEKYFLMANDLWDAEKHKFSKPELAIKYYTRAIELVPELAEAYYNRGLAYADLGQYKQAIKDYDRAIELNPEDAEAYYNRGLGYLMLNIIQAGCSDLKTACKLGDCKGLEFVRKEGVCLMP